MSLAPEDFQRCLLLVSVSCLIHCEEDKITAARHYLALANGMLTTTWRWIRRPLTAVFVTIVAVPEDVPKQPSNDPVFFLEALGVSTHIVEESRHWSGLLVDVQDLPVCGGLVELRITEGWLHILLASISQDVWGRHHPIAASACFFLMPLISRCEGTASEIRRNQPSSCDTAACVAGYARRVRDAP